MTIEGIIAAVKHSPAFAAIVREELSKRVPLPVDMNARILASRPETTEKRADRLAGHMRSTASPISEAPAEPRVAATRTVVPPPDLNERLKAARQR